MMMHRENGFRQHEAVDNGETGTAFVGECLPGWNNGIG